MSRHGLIFLSTGEVSGDVVGARLASALLNTDPSARIFGVGGKRMEKAGVRVAFKTNQLGSVGLTEPLTTLPGIVRTFICIRQEFQQKKPDVAVLIGNDVFHFFLARWLRKNRVPTIAYFPPQVWLWRALARPIASSFDQILTSFEEEHDVYTRAGGQTAFIGHYLSDSIKERTTDEKYKSRKTLGLNPDATIIGLFPGSRTQEVRAHTTACLNAVKELLVRDPSILFILSVADSCYWDGFQVEIRNRGLSKSVLLCQKNRSVMPACDLLLLCSGTATLEATLMRIPMVVFYRLSVLTELSVKFLIFLGLIKSDTIGLPNLLAGRPIVKELHQKEVTGPELAKEAWSILKDQNKQVVMEKNLKLLRNVLGPKRSLDRAAGNILDWANRGRNRRFSQARLVGKLYE